jgi:hypothetical protein
MQLYRHLTANHITLKPMPFLRELSMEAYLVENPEILALDTDELSSVAVIEAEVPVPKGRPSRQGDGRIDLIASYGEATLGIIELKLARISHTFS